ncbi:hypothetical protein DCS_05261 [Drechmeria coniospora]|uniref:Uncharacterized protein n=1 Tax=Drechmeria coniospora TaxID=98403 RepID=A0A151GME9_DRECN|nr:hypothetical protein DCS_05261 [Drechmeria coniospora]KYK58248.1 hypothetical protein DCS_05261 [Drechmeria coniospora]ODA84322.1 hypothetical protein RJ55_02842 [Drechmeria coniospora]
MVLLRSLGRDWHSNNGRPAPVKPASRLGRIEDHVVSGAPEFVSPAKEGTGSAYVQPSSKPRGPPPPPPPPPRRRASPSGAGADSAATHALGLQRRLAWRSSPQPVLR